MTEIIIDIEALEEDEYCGDCRFLNELEEECSLFSQGLYCDAMMQYFRCEVCAERERREDG
jgi:hypothetical protein